MVGQWVAVAWLASWGVINFQVCTVWKCSPVTSSLLQLCWICLYWKLLMHIKVFIWVWTPPSDLGLLSITHPAGVRWGAPAFNASAQNSNFITSRFISQRISGGVSFDNSCGYRSPSCCPSGIDVLFIGTWTKTGSKLISVVNRGRRGWGKEEKDRWVHIFGFMAILIYSSAVWRLLLIQIKALLSQATRRPSLHSSDKPKETRELCLKERGPGHSGAAWWCSSQICMFRTHASQ